MKFIFYVVLSYVVLITSCQKRQDQIRVFEKLDPQKTGVTFSNTIIESDSLNILDYLYFYNGAGVASADFNNDGLEDLYFISNQASNKLYLNKGSLKFEDITHKAGVEGTGNWKTGVIVVDINGDGYKDIYVSAVSGIKGFQGKNQLYINNGNLTFTESASKWGVDFEGLSTQASFFDYDKDGDLDLFVLTHSVHGSDTYGDSTLRFKYNQIGGDHLFKNAGNHFTDVTKNSGIYAAPIGYGLGISISDLNNDGWDDIYISNDFFEQDYYYVNQQNGTFKEKLKDAFGHTSLFSMGNTISDINKDGNLDVITTDMLPEDIKALKSTINDKPLDIYNLEVKSGFAHQYSKNSLQLNVANGKKFIDIGLYSGISATDWTWSPIVQDFDMDGRKDLFFSNGIKRRLNDLDYLKYLGAKNVVNDNSKKFDQSKISRMPDGRVHNYFYHGDSLLKFTDISSGNDMQQPSASSGAISVDLDNDGDLEIVVNNMDETAFISKNLTIETNKKERPVYLSYSIKYKQGNLDGIGTKFFLKSDNSIDHQEVQTSNAFQSSQSTNLFFTFLPEDTAKELLIIWPNNTFQKINNFSFNKKQSIVYDRTKVLLATNISSVIDDFIKSKTQLEYEIVDAQQVAKVKVSETPDFNYYSLLPHTYLSHPPAIAVADINKDGLDDMYVGGITGEEKYLLLGTKDGKFSKVKVPEFQMFIESSDAEAQWVDLDNDSDFDLVVTNAEHPFTDLDRIKSQRIFLNNGKNKFEYIALPKTTSLTSKLCIIDFNGDGLKDIFLPGAVSFRNYTKTLPSYLFLNRGKGKFEVAPKELSKEIAEIPYIKNIAIADIDRDGNEDLIIAAEWQSICIFLNNGKTFKKFTTPLLEKLQGWWQSVSISDVDLDGKADLIAGNWGLNNKYNVSAETPLMAYNNDVDNDEKNDLILSYYFQGKQYPFRPKNDLEQELPYLKKEWLSYQKMADKTTKEVFQNRINENNRLKANCFESIFVSDVLNAKTVTDLPFLYQQAPIMSMLPDVKKSNKVIINGNFWGAIPYEGKYDALGLATLEFSKEKKKFLNPKYWINPAFNFQEISYLHSLKRGKYTDNVIMTNDGRLIVVSKNH